MGVLGVSEERRAVRAFAAANERLRELGVVRANSPVGEIGEWIAARLYGVELAPARTHGYDLIMKDGERVQVKTLRDGNSGRRRVAGAVKGPCDLLLLVRLSEDFEPVYADQVPIEVVREKFPNGRVEWSKDLMLDSRVVRIETDQLEF